ncbi:HDOD domain-containing protein [Pseudaquabacterium pictum]|uniref:HD family phosphohydrolase n=1 Tax=Pseudaquabacterium pictum TaxID=2315236 RepID=A0A480AKD5_9BURK|nr:HDOD domain-containing protein [Rubrivivax pictus]GCL62011.1 HD family phosphohydrolase [Rubrivivax pictus]
MHTAAPPRSPQVNPAQAQSERLAWLFRGCDGTQGPVHPLLQPLSCLRDLGDAAVLIPPPPTRTPQPQPPRHTIDRAWLCARVDALPALPQAVLAAIRVLQQDGSSTAQCAAALGRDPALAAMLLRLANAAAYGRSGRIGSLYEAVALLGRAAVGSVLTAAAVAAQFQDARCPGFDRQRYSRQAFASGIAAQTLANELGADGGLAFTAGLLHDIGHLVLVSQLPAAMAQAMAWARLHDQPLHLAEQEVLGIDHAEAGALVARHWHFPPALVAAVAGHHGTGAQPAAEHAWLLDVVQGADALVHALDLHQAEDERVPDLDPALWQRLDLSPARCARVLAVTEQGVAALAGALTP